MAKTIGEIAVNISARTVDLTKGINATTKALGSFSLAATRAIGNFSKMVRREVVGSVRAFGRLAGSIKRTVLSVKGLAVALAVGAFGKFTANAFSQIDALAKTADKLNISTEALAGYQEAAEDAGISNETLERSLTMLAKKTGQNADVALVDLIKKLEQAGSAQEQLTLATQAFGMRGSAMVRLLRGGSAAFAAGAADATKFGTAVDRASARGVERAIMAFNDLKASIGGVFRSLAVEIAPYVEVLSAKLANFVAEGGRSKNVGRAISDSIVKGVGVMGDAIQKMVEGVLAMTKDMKGLVEWVKGQKVTADKVGSTWKMFNTIDPNAAMGTPRHLLAEPKIPSQSRGGPPAMRFSEWLKGQVSSARSEAAKQAAEMGPKSGNILGRVLSRAMGNFVQQQKSKLQNFGGPGFQLMLKMMMKGMAFSPANQKKLSTPTTSPLSFAESGSADSYRQQAAIRKQSEAIPRKSLKVQELMLAEMRGINTKTMPMREARV